MGKYDRVKMIDYKTIFKKVESSLIKLGSQSKPVEEIRKRLDHFKHLAGHISITDIDI